MSDLFDFRFPNRFGISDVRSNKWFLAREIRGKLIIQPSTALYYLINMGKIENTKSIRKSEIE